MAGRNLRQIILDLARSLALAGAQVIDVKNIPHTGKVIFGVTVDLRWGTGAPLLTPLVPVKQGYVSWLPSDKVSIDFGFFDTIFGGEVADEWQNANYTRGALYFLRQPFNHMGIRSAFAFSDTFGKREEERSEQHRPDCRDEREDDADERHTEEHQAQVSR